MYLDVEVVVLYQRGYQVLVGGHCRLALQVVERSQGDLREQGGHICKIHFDEMMIQAQSDQPGRT